MFNSLGIFALFFVCFGHTDVLFVKPKKINSIEREIEKEISRLRASLTIGCGRISVSLVSTQEHVH